MANILAAASSWWAGHISAALVQANLVDPLNTALVGVGPMASGQVSITPTAANTLTSQAVTLPSGRFSSAPLVYVILNSGVTSTATAIVAWSSGITTTGFTANVVRSNTTATALLWIAVLAS